ncbi:MAG: hypothetical protein Q8O70_10935, partial [Burkholderiales bacterium]|nr:hypothetical protein [Burkholderiales bacterium]
MSQQITRAADGRSDEEVAQDEKYWSRVRKAYDLHPEVINFDHGWTNPTVRSATDLLVKSARELEALPAEMLPKLWETVRNTDLRASLAAAMAVRPDEIALVRNATEALDT